MEVSLGPVDIGVKLTLVVVWYWNTVCQNLKYRNNCKSWCLNKNIYLKVK